MARLTERWGEAPDESRLNLAAHTRGTVRRPHIESNEKTGIRCRISDKFELPRQLSGLKHMAVGMELPDLILAKLARRRNLVLSQVGYISPHQQLASAVTAPSIFLSYFFFN